MKTTSFFSFGIILIVFLAIQGWVLARAFIAPRVFTATEAYLMGETVEIRSPMPGIVRAIDVQEGQRVEEDQELFVIARMVADSLTKEWREEDLPIIARRAGIVTGLQTIPGAFVQGDQKLATIVNNSPESIYVSARLLVEPGDVPRIRPMLHSIVRADFLAGGQPIAAVVRVVDPLYDPDHGTIGVRLQMLDLPDGATKSLPIGLPVEAEVREERRTDENMVIALFHRFFPFSAAQDD